MAEKNIRIKDADGNYLYPRARVGNIIDTDGNIVDFSTFATKQELSQVSNFSVSVVNSLPDTSEASENVIYLVPNDEGTDNYYIEYLFVNGAFEKIGTTKIDLSGYATDGDVAHQIGLLTKSKTGVIDTRISEYTYDKDVIDQKISQATGTIQYEVIS